MIVRKIVGIIQAVIKIRPPAVKRREEEAKLGRADGVGPALIVKFLFLRVVAKGGLSGLDRADGAEHVGEDLAAVFQMHAVLCLEGHVVALVGKEDQIVVLRGKRACDRLIECFERLFVV